MWNLFFAQRPHDAVTPPETSLMHATKFGYGADALATCPVADINRRSGRFGQTPLHTAWMCEDLQALLDAGADPAIMPDVLFDSRGKSTVHWSTRPNMRAMVAPHLAWSTSIRYAWLKACVVSAHDMTSSRC